MPEPHYQVRALERALDIVDAFSLGRPELSLSEIAQLANIPKSTTLRLLAILEERGYLERSPDTDRYRLGVRLFEAGSIYIQSTTLEREAQPFLQTLARECNQTANLAVLNRGEIVHVAVVPPERPIRFWATVGQREQAHCTGLGKALLSGLSDDDLAQVVAERGLPERTPHTVGTLEALRRQLAMVRTSGVAVDDEESELGLVCIAAPIRDHRNNVIAAVSVSGPAAEFDAGARARFTAAVRRAGEGISARLGHAIQV